MEFPTLSILDQNFAGTADTEAQPAVARELERTDLLEPVQAGQQVIITAGSRGVDSMAGVLRHKR